MYVLIRTQPKEDSKRTLCRSPELSVDVQPPSFQSLAYEFQSLGDSPSPQLRTLLGSAWDPPACSVAWDLFGQLDEAILELTSFVSHLTEIIVLPFLISSILKTTVSYISFGFFLIVLGQKVAGSQSHSYASLFIHSPFFPLPPQTLLLPRHAIYAKISFRLTEDNMVSNQVHALGVRHTVVQISALPVPCVMLAKLFHQFQPQFLYLKKVQMIPSYRVVVRIK